MVKAAIVQKWKFVSSKIEHFLNILITLTVMKRHVQKNLSNTTCFLPMDTIITWKILKNRQDSLQVRKNQLTSEERRQVKKNF